MKIRILFIALLVSSFSFGQILTFDFAGLAGSEATAGSNTNDANLTTSTISRGAGLTASANVDRYNATNWSTVSIANAVTNNQYMQFTITPNATYEFTVSSVVIQLQRSGTGPSAIALRNSLDGYAANLDAQYTITDNTATQTFTFTFSQAASTTAVTYRMYMYAEAAGGTGGPGDGTGNDIIVNGTVTSTTACSTPTSQASSITIANTTVGGTDISWTPGATATGSLVVIRPTASANALPVSGTNYTPNTAWASAAQIDTNNRVVYRSTGAAVTGITGLLPETSYTISVYAYNGSGTNICYNTTTPEAIFFITLAPEPTAHAASFTCLTASATQINLTFSAANTIGGDGYIVLYRIGAAPTGIPTDGTFYTVGAAIGNSTYAGITAATGTTTTFSATGLNSGTTYYFSLIPYSSYLSDPSTLNYRTAATIPTTFCTTMLGAEMNVRGFVGSNPTIADGDITPQGTDNTLFASVVVGNNQDKRFIIENLGNANLTISSITMVGGNTADFAALTYPVPAPISFPLTITAGSSYDFYVRFAPGAAGTRNTTLTIANNDSNENPYNFIIQGTGTLVSLVDINLKGNGQSIPDNSIYPQGTNHTAFGLATVGVTTVTRTFTIENLGSTALSLTGAPYVTVTGTNASMFTVTAQPSSGTIAGSSSLTFDVTFNPTSPGAKNATVIIASNDPDENPYNFNISGNAKGTNNIYVYGNGFDVNKGATTTSLTNLTNFGSVAVTTGVKQNTFVISNLSGISTYYSSVSISGADAAMFSVVAQPTNNSLGSGNSTSFTINFTPTTSGIKTASVSFNVYTDAARTVAEPVDPVYTFAISGEGIVYTPCTNSSVQTLAIQDFEAAPAAPTYNYTYTTDGTVSIAGGTYNNGSGALNAFVGARSFQMAGIGTTVSGNLVETSVITMSPVDVSQYTNINLSMKVGAFRTGSQGLDINEFVQVETSVDGGTNWSTEAVLRAYSNSRWDFNASGVFNAYYTGTNNGATIDTRNGNAELANGIATYYVKNLPASTSLLIRITLAVDRSDEIWAIDNIKIEGQTPNSSTWNGTTWVGGFPTSSTKAIFDADYTTTAAVNHGSVEACECQINANRNVIVDTGYYFEIQSNLTNNGSLTIANNASLVQLNDAATNSGNITYQRTATGVRGSDYVYWSSPVVGQSVTGLYSTPTTPGFIYRWNPTATNINSPVSSGNWQGYTGTMGVGDGYIVRGSSNYNMTSSSIPASFFGAVNNGVVPVTISRANNTALTTPGPGNGITITNFDDNWNLVGNPYPSAINAINFLQGNSEIQGFVYLWTHNTAPATIINPFYGSYLYNYTTNDYITYNSVGASSGPSVFNGYIAGGQGFFVMMNDGASASGTINFKNSMRNKGYSNSQFYKSVPIGNDEKHRIWLDLVNTNNQSVRTLVGYVSEATTGLDRLCDAFKNTANTFEIYSMAEGQTLTIQGRPAPFDSNDLVPIGIRVMQAGEHKIAIAAVDGLFSDASQNIYLEDKLLGVIHDLRLSPYSFNADAGIINDRFILRYSTTTLSNPDVGTADNNVIVTSNQGQLGIKSAVEMIQDVTVFDILGRQLLDAKSVGCKDFITSNISISQQALIVKIKLENGTIVTRKIVL